MMNFLKIGNVWLLVFLLCFSIGCAATNKNAVQKDIKDLPIKLEKLDAQKLFVDPSIEKPSRDFSISSNSKGEEIIAYPKLEHDKIVTRLIDGNQNLETGKVIVDKYNLMIDQIGMCNDLYRIEQEKSWLYKTQLDETQEVLEKQQKWDKIENEVLKYSLIIIAIAALSVAAQSN